MSEEIQVTTGFSATGISGQRFKLKIHRLDSLGGIGELTEEGICSMDAATLAIIDEGKGDPNKYFDVDAGILGSFQKIKKEMISYSPAGVRGGIVFSKYTIEYRIYGTNFSSILVPASGSAPGP